MSETKHYVCDKCGALWASPGGDLRCPDCGADALWQFTDSRKAWDHAAMISDRKTVAS